MKFTKSMLDKDAERLIPEISNTELFDEIYETYQICYNNYHANNYHDVHIARASSIMFVLAKQTFMTLPEIYKSDTFDTCMSFLKYKSLSQRRSKEVTE